MQKPDSLSAWLCGIARNLGKKWLRERHGKLSEVENQLKNRSSSAAINATEDREEAAQIVWETLKTLPPNYREPLVMFYQENSSIREIAAALEISEDAVKQRLSRGRVQLRDAVTDKIEAVLGKVHPGRHFCMAVLASIPTLAAASDVFAATAATTAGATARASGHSIFAATGGTWLWSLFSACFFPLTFFFGVLTGAWNSIRHAPTLRSRRFMLKQVIWHTMIALSYWWCLWLTLIRNFALYTPLSGPSAMHRFLMIYYIGGWCIIAIYCVISAYRGNKKWRQIVQEDQSNGVDYETLETSNLSLSAMRRQLRQSFFYPVIALMLVVVFILIESLLLQRTDKPLRFFDIFSYSLIHTLSAPILWIYLLLIPAVLIAFYCFSQRYLLNAESMKRYPPVEPDLLPILSGERKPRNGYHFRTNFWNDALLYGVWLCLMQGITCAASFSNTLAPYVQMWSWGIIGISFAMYLGFVVTFAGIPRRRYWGFIGFTLFFILLDCTYLFLLEPWLLRDAAHLLQFMILPSQTWETLVPILLIPLCIVMIGVIGLVVFRKPLKSD